MTKIWPTEHSTEYYTNSLCECDWIVVCPTSSFGWSTSEKHPLGYTTLDRGRNLRSVVNIWIQRSTLLDSSIDFILRALRPLRLQDTWSPITQHSSLITHHSSPITHHPSVMGHHPRVICDKWWVMSDGKGVLSDERWVMDVIIISVTRRARSDVSESLTKR